MVETSPASLSESAAETNHYQSSSMAQNHHVQSESMGQTPRAWDRRAEQIVSEIVLQLLRQLRQEL